MFVKKLKEQFFRSSEEKFWDWFIANETSIYELEKNKEGVIYQIDKAIKKVNRGLVFEIGSADKQGKRDFVISADGVIQTFPAVESLYSKAPKLDRWTIYKFRQRTGIDPNEVITYQGKTVNYNDIRFLLLDDENPNKVGILLFIPGYADQDKELLYGISFIVLDHVIGEYDIAMRIGLIELDDKSSEHYERALPINQLPAQFDNFFQELKSK